MRKYNAGHIIDDLANDAGSKVVNGLNSTLKNALRRHTMAYGVHDMMKKAKLKIKILKFFCKFCLTIKVFF